MLLGSMVACHPHAGDATHEAKPTAQIPKGDLPRAMPGPDPHSHARPTEVVVRHLGLDWTVSFEERRLVGTATLWVERANPSAPLWLDARDLEIEAVETGVRPTGPDDAVPRLARVEGVPWSATAWSLGERDAILGQPLRVELPAGADLVRIRYRTSPEATGLQWLEPRQTAEGTDPFLYSQSQAIHARSWIPCQDSPGVRVTYDAVVQVPATEGAEDRVALMSARRIEDAPGLAPGEHRFEMPQPIPAYLVALAVGRVEFEALGERSGVWAEPSVRPVAARELADTERMMAVAESLYGPYRWERYDVLVLPPAFPFGGMENPRLTFVTPTILAGDRSLVALVAHELAHSWSGNLVTNATWDDTWLNEGFTVYIERRIVEALYGRGRAEMEAMLGRQDLDEELRRLASPDDSRLHLDLRGRDPDEGLSDVAYEKGALFLRELEESYGREAFDPWIRAWFDGHAFTSVTSEALEAFLDRELVQRRGPLPSRRAARPEAWIHAPGVPEGAPEPRSDAFAKVDAVLATLASRETSARSLPTEGWTPHQWLHFLRGLPPALPLATLAELDARFSLTASTNYEILAKWLELAVLRGYAAADERLEQFLRTVGRRKFLLPLYEALLSAGRRDDAVRIYGGARPGYHPVTQHSLDALLQG